MNDIELDSIPTWARGVRTRYDENRSRWMILGPERILVPEGPGGDIARLIDGERSVDDIVTALVEEYDADVSTIRNDTTAFLQQLVDQGYLNVATTDSAPQR